MPYRLCAKSSKAFENDEFKITHGRPVRLQKEALNSQQFSSLTAANQKAVAMPTETASMNRRTPT